MISIEIRTIVELLIIAMGITALGVMCIILLL